MTFGVLRPAGAFPFPESSEPSFLHSARFRLQHRMKEKNGCVKVRLGFRFTQPRKALASEFSWVFNLDFT